LTIERVHYCLRCTRDVLCQSDERKVHTGGRALLCWLDALLARLGLYRAGWRVMKIAAARRELLRYFDELKELRKAHPFRDEGRAP
jgi:hypothetical protein